MDNPVDLEVQLLHETDSAYLVTETIPELGVWLPKSQCELEETSVRGIYTLTLPQWLATEKELI
jgi:hypothetical protein